MSKKEKLELLALLDEKERIKARENFWAFCVYMDPRFFTEKKQHLKKAAGVLQKVEDGEISKLAISMPPRAGKSYLISMWCAWRIGKHPEGSIMRNSYAAELAETFSYHIREIVQTPKYVKCFPEVKLKKDKKSVTDWSITKARQTTYFCAGVGGAITGKGCTLAAILDDPIKNIEDALSEIVLEKTWQWYTSTHLSRLETGCPEIHIATRWSRKDPIGRLLAEYPDDWTVIVISALDENGESFCSEIKTTKEYLDIKKVTDDFIWEAEFMQNPVESKGLLLPIEELKRFSLSDLSNKKPDGIIGFTDTADKGEDFLCSPVGKMFNGYCYIADVVFTQDGVEITEPLVAQQIIDTKCEIMVIESNNGGRSFALNVRKLIRGKSHCSVKYEVTTTNKETRILMQAGYIKENFYFRNDYKPGSDYDKFMRQLTSYVRLGKNKHDDANDAVTKLAEHVKNMLFKKPKTELPGKFYTPTELEDLGETSMRIRRVK